MKKLIRKMLILPILLLAACSSQTSQPTPEQNNKPAEQKSAAAEGEIKVAASTQPPTLDPHMTTTSIVKSLSRHIFETLLTIDENYKPVPMLAESVEKSEDGKTYTFKLRQGVKFHNGKEMTAEDVVASLNKWKEVSAAAKVTLKDATFESVDPYTVKLNLPQPSSEVLDVIASPKQFSGIMPKEVVEAAGPDGAKKYIGTGPFQFTEWKQDQYIKLSKFDGYQSVQTPASGLSGKKEVFVKDIYFYFVNDPSTRLAGVQTGQYDVAENMPWNNYDQIKSNPDLKPSVEVSGNMGLVFNKKEGIFTNVKMRQAVNTAIDAENVMLASFSHPDLFDLNSGYINEKIKDWYSNAGDAGFNQNNNEKAKQLLQEAGYKGEAVRLMVTRDYDHHYNIAIVVKDQLEKIGMKVNLETYDWATVVSRRSKPTDYDMFITGFSTVSTPSQIIYLSPRWPGWTEDAKIETGLQSIGLAASQAEAKKQWDALQAYVATEYLPIVTFGDYKEISVSTNKLDGYQYFEGHVLWNTKLVD